ncbi:hypothetical protein H072_2032 [Dactylellina haptotyla CBS 200.50]|uniref:C2H2-type domain-containing protein n=1 Tax=Dactylellina haptotyla (strain CBS 200.50) TaxID=1284197 RepID=S8BWP4_DACHA|nr:hypothetical protein H072_2032 [Dactylellina haptotyla CBS 200.50]
MPSSTASASLSLAPDIIEKASQQTLRNILHALCAADSKIQERIEKFHDGMQALARRASNNKRRAESEIAVCIVCTEAFDEADNHDTACQTHPGEWEADTDHEAWYHHGWGGNAAYNDEDLFRDMPEAFIMDCCEQPGDSDGCQVQRHTTRYDEMERSQESDDDEGSELPPTPSSGVASPSVVDLTKNED